MLKVTLFLSTLRFELSHLATTTGAMLHNQGSGHTYMYHTVQWFATQERDLNGKLLIRLWVR